MGNNPTDEAHRIITNAVDATSDFAGAAKDAGVDSLKLALDTLHAAVKKVEDVLRQKESK